MILATTTAGCAEMQKTTKLLIVSDFGGELGVIVFRMKTT